MAVQETGGGTPSSSAPPPWEIGGTVVLVWSGGVIYVPRAYGVSVGGTIVAASTLTPFTVIDAEQYVGFNDVAIRAAEAGAPGAAAIAHYQSTQPAGSSGPSTSTSPSSADDDVLTASEAAAAADDEREGGELDDHGGHSSALVTDSATPGLDGFDFANASDEEIIEYVREELGFLAWMLEIPELQALVLSALREGDTEEAILAGLQNTEWWRTTEPQTREWTRLQAEDPAFARRLISDVALNIRLEAMRLGIDLDPERIEAMAGEAITFGWVSLEGAERGNLLRAAIFNEAKFRPTDLVPGALAVTIDDLVQVADDYMITLSEDAAAVWAERIELGETDAKAFEQYIQGLSASRFPHLKGIIEQGISPRSHFEPYRQQVAALLEVNPDEVDLFNDPRFADIVELQTDQGVRSMTLAETQKFVRQMPEWQTTMNGLTTAARTAESLLKVFGEV
jgi:hypothetical protein